MGVKEVDLKIAGQFLSQMSQLLWLDGVKDHWEKEINTTCLLVGCFPGEVDGGLQAPAVQHQLILRTP